MYDGSYVDGGDIFAFRLSASVEGIMFASGNKQERRSHTRFFIGVESRYL